MCLFVKEEWRKDRDGKIIPSTARKDIICYKRLKRESWGVPGYKTPHQGLSVNIGSRGSRLKAELGIYQNRVNEGIHAYTNITKGKETMWERDILVKSIIPKGAKYIRGRENDIVATEMKLGRIVYRQK